MERNVVASVERDEADRPAAGAAAEADDLARVDLIPLEDDRALAVLVPTPDGCRARRDAGPPESARRGPGRRTRAESAIRRHTVQDVVDMETMPSDPLDALHTRARAR